MTRSLVSAPVTGEDLLFPCAAQIARLHRQRTGRQLEAVCLVTSRPAAEMAPEQWLAADIDHWGVEIGTARPARSLALRRRLPSP